MSSNLDHKAFEVLYRLHWDKVYAVCFHYTQSRCIAEDMVQEIFQSVWERRRDIVFRVSEENYLVGAAKLKVFEYFRNNSIRTKHQEQLSRIRIDQENSTENMVLYRETAQTIYNRSHQLPPQAKKIYELSRNAGMSPRTIAKAFSLSEKTVKNHLTKALRFLRAGFTGSKK